MRENVTVRAKLCFTKLSIAQVSFLHQNSIPLFLSIRKNTCGCIVTCYAGSIIYKLYACLRSICLLIVELHFLAILFGPEGKRVCVCVGLQTGCTPQKQSIAVCSTSL